MHSIYSRPNERTMYGALAVDIFAILKSIWSAMWDAKPALMSVASPLLRPQTWCFQWNAGHRKNKWPVVLSTIYLHEIRFPSFPFAHFVRSSSSDTLSCIKQQMNWPLPKWSVFFRLTFTPIILSALVHGTSDTGWCCYHQPTFLPDGTRPFHSPKFMPFRKKATQDIQFRRTNSFSLYATRSALVIREATLRFRQQNATRAQNTLLCYCHRRDYWARPPIQM